MSKQEISGTEKGLRSRTNTRDYKMGSCLEIDGIVILVGSPIPNRSKGRNQRKSNPFLLQKILDLSTELIG